MAPLPRVIRLEPPHERPLEIEIIGTPAYRRRQLSVIWTAQLWHELVMVLAGIGSIGLLFYAIARDIMS